MNVPSTGFPEELIHIIQHVADSQFVAIDLEFSGVAGRRSAGGTGKLTLQDYYQDLRSAAQIYQILQVGLTTVSEDIDNGEPMKLSTPHACESICYHEHEMKPAL